MQSFPWQKVPDPFARRRAKSANPSSKIGRVALKSPHFAQKNPRTFALKMGHPIR
ncbi:hypothetical protein I41_41560 [Lacipirellula limnantheis]|uniref:Uncharacterized protein n=1 Tax=Lacipirellula limnantheis TaxID=2528024 RepID=A0A517U2U6_9BACT|nr:hypothetical protein I41_41560 [Lacipirellula limnantheis]